MNFRQFFFFSFLSLGLLSFIGFANAQSVDAQGAETVKAMFQEIIDGQTAMNAMEGASQIKYEGELTVEPAGSYYAVTFPHMKVNYPTGEIIDIGMISANVKPHSAPGQWATTLALPTPFVFLNADGTEAFKIHIGGQSTAGIWDQETVTPYKLDGLYKDIRVETIDADTPFSFVLPELRTRYDFSIDDKGFWSGPGFLSVKDIAVDFPEQDGKMQIGEFRLDIKVDQYDPKSSNAFREEMIALVQNEDGTAKEMNAQDQQAIFDLLSTYVFKSSNGFAGSYTVNDFKVEQPESIGPARKTMAFSNASFGFDASGFLEETVDFKFNMGLTGLSLAPLPPELPAKLFPSDFSFGLAIEDVPLEAVMEKAKETAALDPQNGTSSQAAMMGLAMQLPLILSEAGTKFRLEKNHIKSAVYGAEVSGVFEASPASQLMSVGDGKVVLKGLDDLMSQLTALIGRDPQSVAAAQYQQALMGLGMVKAFAKPEAGEDGTINYVLNLSLTQDGKALINGQDLNAMMGGGAPGGMPPPPPAQTEPTPDPVQETP